MVEWLHGDLSISNGAFLVLMILIGWHEWFREKRSQSELVALELKVGKLSDDVYRLKH